MTRDVVLLGSTGSIGTQALDIVAANPDKFRVVALAAGGNNLELLARQVIDFEVGTIAVADAAKREDLFAVLRLEAQKRGHSLRPVEVLGGADAAAQLATMPAEVVLNGMTGSVGLRPTLAALESGTTLALANKESLVVGGHVVTSAAKPGQIVPVDSEHSALAQSLRAGAPNEVRRLILTASGGPFRGWDAARLAEVTVDQALAHPTWDMGPVVTINSATLMNKGLEVIEAHLLFGIDFDRISTVVHPQSVVHSMVEFDDGSTIAQASPPDMRLPIALGMSWPDRVPNAASACDWTKAATWEFFPLDEEAFPAVRLARQAGKAAGTAPAVYNAANEECVQAFLNGSLAFSEIVPTVESIVEQHMLTNSGPLGTGHIDDSSLTVEAVLAAESWARAEARSQQQSGR